MTEAVCVKGGGARKGENKDKSGSKCFPFGDWVADVLTNREVWKRNTSGITLNNTISWLNLAAVRPAFKIINRI